MIDVGLIVTSLNGSNRRSVSAMLPDETEFAQSFDVDDELQRTSYIEQLAAACKRKPIEFEYLHNEILDKSKLADRVGGTAIEKFTLGELVKKYPVLKRPVIECFLREGEVGNIVSIPKVGKSWGAYQLGISVAMGWDWLGKFPVKQGRVLLVDNELHPESLAYRIPKVAAAMGEARGDFFGTDQLLEGLHVMPLRGNLRTLKELGVEFERIERDYYSLVIFDAKYRFALAGVSENDNSAETQVSNLLDMYADQLNAALLLIHHSSKGGQSDKRVTDVGSGAGAQSRAADCHMVLREHEEEGLMVLDAAVRIRDSGKPSQRLYRDTHDTFEEYCRDRWGYSKSRANQFIDASCIFSTASEAICRYSSGRFDCGG